MKLTKLAVNSCCDHPTIFAKIQDGTHHGVHPCTLDELRKVVDTYNAVADAAEGSNNLPYQMTFQLLKESDIAEHVQTPVA